MALCMLLFLLEIHVDLYTLYYTHTYTHIRSIYRIKLCIVFVSLRLWGKAINHQNVNLVEQSLLYHKTKRYSFWVPDEPRISFQNLSWHEGNPILWSLQNKNAFIIGTKEWIHTIGNGYDSAFCKARKENFMTTPRFHLMCNTFGSNSIDSINHSSETNHQSDLVIYPYCKQWQSSPIRTFTFFLIASMLIFLQVM